MLSPSTTTTTKTISHKMLPTTTTSRRTTKTSRTTTTTLLWFYTISLLYGFINAQAVGSKDLYRCRQTCYQKFVRDWHHCMDFDDCKNMCITPPNINSYIPEAFSFLCWNNCNQQLGPFSLTVNSALRQDTLVLTNIVWDQAITNASKQCLVTWEVSGGGLMGNLLTDSSTVELSLWADTIYHVQVTCKHKDTGGMRRSYELIVDTHKLIENQNTATNLHGIVLDNNLDTSHIYDQDTLRTTNQAEALAPVLKHSGSSKDFLSPYKPEREPNAQTLNHIDTPKSNRRTHLNQLRHNANKQASDSLSDSTTNSNSHNSRSEPLHAYSMLDPSQITSLAIILAITAFTALLLLLRCLLVLRPRSKHVDTLCAAVAVTAPAGSTTSDRGPLIQAEMPPIHTQLAVGMCQTSRATNEEATRTVTHANTCSTASQTMPTTCVSVTPKLNA